MGIDNWLVEEEITLDTALDIHAVYIRLLEQVIEALKETEHYETEDLVEDNPVYSLPTVIFAYLAPGETKSTKLAQLMCFRDREDFMESAESWEGISFVVL